MDNDNRETKQDNLDEQKLVDKKKSISNDSEENYMSLGMCFGMCFGMIFGQLFFDNLATGIGVGMCLGLAIGISIKKKK